MVHSSVEPGFPREHAAGAHKAADGDINLNTASKGGLQDETVAVIDCVEATRRGNELV